MSSDAERPVSVMTTDKDDVGTDVRLAVSTVDSVVPQRWATPAAAVAATTITTTTTPLDNNNNNDEHHDCIEKTSADEYRGLYHGSTQRPTTPALYSRLPGTEFDTSYDYNYSPHYSSRYTSFQAPSTSAYLGAVTPYAAPYSPSALNPYTFNLAGPCAPAAAYNASYMPHHLASPSAALLTSERSAPSYRFTASSTSLMQSRTFSIYS